MISKKKKKKNKKNIREEYIKTRKEKNYNVCNYELKKSARLICHLFTGFAQHSEQTESTGPQFHLQSGLFWKVLSHRYDLSHIIVSTRLFICLCSCEDEL